MTIERRGLSSTTLLAAPLRQPPRWAARLWSWYLGALEIQRQRRALARLESHLLDDIGLTRDDVERELDRSIWK